MKLTSKQVDAVRKQLNVEPVEDDHPVQKELEAAFGVHTFYADPNGLHIFEKAEPAGVEAGQGEFGVIMQVAVWEGGNQDSLQSIDPQQVGDIIPLDLEE
ncbi:MAG: hypothetical protein ISR51_02200 [Rhodospirillales bacterium]|nr:hypothetical protein [Alphaproteobacteria bacterium]MBL6947464.1 hypothetical protein [Rhodospirillales bacterium]